MRKQILLATAVLALASGTLLMNTSAQQQPGETPALPPAGGGPAAAAAFKSYETTWDKFPQGEKGEGVPAFYVREGYKVTVASDPIPNGVRAGRAGGTQNEARFLALDPVNGTIFCSQPTGGQIIALQDATNSGKYAVVGPLVAGKPQVHGLCFKDGFLWFSTDDSICKVKVTKEGKADGEVVVVAADLPKNTPPGHWWRSILVTDDCFFTSVGDPQNDSDQTATDKEKIWKFSLDGKTKELWCSGIRNTEKLQYRPGTTELWGCDHGSDNFGGNLNENAQNQPVTDTYPPDEFNHYIKDGFYGHPFVIGDRIPRSEYARRPDILAIAANTIAPAWDVGAHFATNGWTFVTKDSAVAHKGDVLIACHGSWNATVKRGYRIQKVLFDQETGLPYGAIQLVGTLAPDHGRTLGRPVDVQEMPDGSFLFSDDQNNRIWRLAASAGRTEPK